MVALVRRAPRSAVRGAMAARLARHRHRIALALVCLAAAAIQFTYVSRGWFYLDDFRNLGDAHREGFTWHFFTSPIGNEHFQPGGRLLHWWAGIGGHPHYHLAVALVALCVGATAYLTARVADELFGPRKLHLLLAALIGTSSTLVETSTWYAGSDSIPAAALVAGCLLLYVRWYCHGGWPRLAGSVICAGTALLFWEQSIILPFLLSLVWACFLRSAGQRSMPQVALSILPFVALSVAFDAYVSAQPWSKPLVVPSVTQVLILLRTMFFRGLLPPIVGWRVATLPLSSSALLSMGLAAAIVLAGAAYLLTQQRFRWSGLVFFAFSFLALAATVAATRVDVGPLAGATPRYLDLLPMLVGLSVAGCASVRRSASIPAPTRIGAAPYPRMLVAATLTVLLGLGYLSALTVSTRNNRFGRLNGQHAHAISDRVNRALHPGMTNLVDTRLRWPVFYTSNNGADEVSTLAPFWARDVHAIGAGDDPIALAPDGSAHRVRFNAGQAGPAQYVRLVVWAAQPGSLRVVIHGVHAQEPNSPYVLNLARGITPYLLPAWAAQVAGIDLQAGAGITVLDKRAGTITLTGPAL